MNSIDLNLYIVKDEQQIATPQILVYPDKIKNNIQRILKLVQIDKLRPHIKTIKSKPVVQLLMDEGITKFKCATLKEAQLLAELGALDVLISYPLVGAHVDNFIKLNSQFPNTLFTTIVDNTYSTQELNTKLSAENFKQEVYIDLNLGMNRTGVQMDQVYNFVHEIKDFSHITIKGLHGYDGHIREESFEARERLTLNTLGKIFQLKKELEETLTYSLNLVLGGSNTFPIYRQYPEIECSPGTFVLWDWGYYTTLPEQNFECAAILLTTVISKPTTQTVCIDLGYKAVASENPLDKRFHILGKTNWNPQFQSEEHLVLQIPSVDWSEVKVGDAIYIVPYHICPTVAMYPYYQVVKAGNIMDKWRIAQRY